ncbi:MAG: choice-of-anchor D domain-containing protein [Wenzhouxiangella sp.]
MLNTSKAVVFLCVFTLIVAMPPSELQAETPSELVFESRPPGDGGGGQGFSTTVFAGHSFRITERTRITEIGFYSDQNFNPFTVFGAIYRLGLVESAPDVVGDVGLKATALISKDTGDPETVSAPIDVILEPGWYSLLFGKGRYGAGDNSLVFLRNTETPQTPVTRGPYSVNVATGQLFLQGASSRVFAMGEVLPPSEPPPLQFLAESAGPAANTLTGPTSGFSSSTVNANTLVGERFELTRPAELESISAWLSSGNGDLYAAVFPVSGPTDFPPALGNPNFEASAVAVVALPTKERADESVGNLEQAVLLQPGHYIVAIGADRFGITGGSGGVAVVNDQINTPGSVRLQSFWSNEAGNNYRIAMQGQLLALTATPTALNFGEVPIELGATQTLELDLWLESSVTFDPPNFDGADAGAFSVDTTTSSCLDGPVTGPATCSLTIAFAPQRLGEHEAQILINAEALDETFSLDLSAVAIAGQAIASVDRNSIDFGVIDIGDISAPETLSINNSGSATAVVEDLTFSDPAFSLASSGCGSLPIQVGPGQSCQLGIQFDAQIPGPASGLLTLEFAGGLDPISVALDAFTLAPDELFEDRFEEAHALE